MLGSSAYGSVEYAGIIPGGSSPRFSLGGKPMKGVIEISASEGSMGQENMRGEGFISDSQGVLDS